MGWTIAQWIEYICVRLVQVAFVLFVLGPIIEQLGWMDRL